MLPDTAQSFRGTLYIHVWIRFLNWKKKKKKNAIPGIVKITNNKNKSYCPSWRLISRKHGPCLIIHIMLKTFMDIFSKSIHIWRRKLCWNLKKLVRQSKSSNTWVKSELGNKQIYNYFAKIIFVYARSRNTNCWEFNCFWCQIKLCFFLQISDLVATLN